MSKGVVFGPSCAPSFAIVSNVSIIGLPVTVMEHNLQAPKQAMHNVLVLLGTFKSTVFFVRIVFVFVFFPGKDRRWSQPFF